MARIVFSWCTGRLDPSYEYHVANGNLSGLLSREQFQAVVSAFPSNVRCGVTVITGVYWIGVLASITGMWVLCTGAVGLGAFVALAGMAVTTCAAVWSRCRRTTLLMQACTALAARHPHLVFKVEPYTVNAWGQTRRHCLLIEPRAEGLEAPLVP